MAATCVASRLPRAGVPRSSSCPLPIERLARIRRASRFYDGSLTKRVLQPWIPPPSFPRDEMAESKHSDELRIFDAHAASTPRRFTEQWSTIDDWVVNGCSVSSVQLLRLPSVGIVMDWHGTLNASSGIGWASARTRDANPAYNLTQYDGIALRVRGDGQRYKLVLRSEQGLMAPTWEAAFDTIRGHWITVKLPWSSFVPFGWHTARGSDQLQLSHIYGLALVLSSFDLPLRTWSTDPFVSKINGSGSDSGDEAVHVRAPHHRYDMASSWRSWVRNPLFGEGPFELSVQHITAYKHGQRLLPDEDEAVAKQRNGTAPLPEESLAIVPQANVAVATTTGSTSKESKRSMAALQAQFKSQWAAEEDRLVDAEGLGHTE